LWYNVQIMSVEKHPQEKYEKYPTEPSIGPELEYLIVDLEEQVNALATELLRDEPYMLEARGYRPQSNYGDTPYGIQELENTHLKGFNSPQREFIGMDLSCVYPLGVAPVDTWNIALKWSDGLQCRLVKTPRASLLTVEESAAHGHIHHAYTMPQEQHELYLESLGLPESFYADDIKELTRDLYSSTDFHLTQRLVAPIDPFTQLELVRDAQLYQDSDDNKQLVHELLIHIDHLDQSTPSYDEDETPLTPHLHYRNSLRFDRDEVAGLWKFKEAYHGKLKAGELLGELVAIDPTLGIPDVRLLEKVLNGLSAETNPY